MIYKKIVKKNTIALKVTSRRINFSKETESTTLFKITSCLSRVTHTMLRRNV